MSILSGIGKGLTIAEFIAKEMLNVESQLPAGSGVAKKAVVVGTTIQSLAASGLAVVNDVTAGDLTDGVGALVEFVGTLKGLFTRHKKLPSPVTGPAPVVPPIVVPPPVLNPPQGPGAPVPASPVIATAQPVPTQAASGPATPASTAVVSTSLL